ncbi:MAG TPA: LysM peptidoglycan-binding domain-containing protein, partial [Bacillota bacterium]|nr:LysM peptidoglycan-binding domain-containing protein [Bacillota bacterium]
MEIYVIRAGDDLFQIAQRFGVTVEAIQQLNQFPDPSRLVIGQAILIPTPAVNPLRYTIVAGDTLYVLAQLFNTTVQALAQANNITNPNQIQVGMTLTIPGWSQVSYTVRSGDTLYQIAARYGIPVSLIAKVNRISNPALIYPGQVLIIPQATPAVIRKNIETFAYFQLVNL